MASLPKIGSQKLVGGAFIVGGVVLLWCGYKKVTK